MFSIKSLRFALRILILSILLFAIFAVASQVAGLGSQENTNTNPKAAIALIEMCILISLVLSYPVLRSRWNGLKLVLTVWLAIFGIMTFLTQIETLVFLNFLVDIIPRSMLPKLILQGFIVATLFAPFVVLINGKMQKREFWLEENTRLVLGTKEWIIKLFIAAICYVLIYISFGLFVFAPLAGEAFQQYYQGLSMPPWILLFQAVRGLIWVGIALPIIRMMKGVWWETGMAVALIFSILMGGQLLVPNDFMPEIIRVSHMVEVMTSNFLFGWIVAGLFSRSHWPFKRIY